jgi:hypothetical protein
MTPSRAQTSVATAGAEPGLELVLHPVPLIALAAMVANDHWLKANHPGLVSGKLSDVAVLVLLPFLFVAFADLPRLRWSRLPAPGRLAVLGSVVLAIAAFVVIEVVPAGGELYRWTLGVLQWPVRAGLATIDGDVVPGIAQVRLTSDLTDLLTLPAALVIFLVLRPRQLAK